MDGILLGGRNNSFVFPEEQSAFPEIKDSR